MKFRPNGTCIVDRSSSQGQIETKLLLHNFAGASCNILLFQLISYVSVKSKLQHPPPRNPPGIWLFRNYYSNCPPTRAKMQFKSPTLGSIQVNKCPHPRDILQAHKWQKEAETLSVVEQNLYSVWQKLRTLLAHLPLTKVSCKAMEIAATWSLNAQLFFVCYATYKGFYKKSHLF